jgi:hypothetical protein
MTGNLRLAWLDSEVEAQSNGRPRRNKLSGLDGDALDLVHSQSAVPVKNEIKRIIFEWKLSGLGAGSHLDTRRLEAAARDRETRRITLAGEGLARERAPAASTSPPPVCISRNRASWRCAPSQVRDNPREEPLRRSDQQYT